MGKSQLPVIRIRHPRHRRHQRIPDMQSTVESLTFRARMAELISPLRSTQPRQPFWVLQSHRLPTLRLYRNLLRYSPNSDVRPPLHP